jgi:hypothetical protein
VSEPAAGLDRGALRYDVELSRRIQVFCAWCGPGFVVLLFGGWGTLGGLIPLIPPAETAEYVAGIYGTNAVVHRIGLILGMIGVFLTIPYFLVISMQLRRMERRVPILSILQLCSGIIVTVVLMIPMLLFVGASFRPERAPELTMLVNDLSYVMLILPWPPIIGQLGAIAVAVITDKNNGTAAGPIFPRWCAYYQVWVGVLLLPASLIIFFKSGPFAWTGIVGFWIPAAVFGSWYLIMTKLLLTAIAREADEDRALAGV